eukprot:535792-Pelagomonas_calceolata.AAC.1
MERDEFRDPCQRSLGNPLRHAAAHMAQVLTEFLPRAANFRWGREMQVLERGACTLENCLCCARTTCITKCTHFFCYQYSR